MIRIVTYETPDGESLFPIALIAAEKEEELEAALQRIREEIAERAWAKVAETFDADDDLDERDRAAKHRRLEEVKREVAASITHSWDELPLVRADEPEKTWPAKMDKAFGKLEEWELLEGL